MLIPFGLVAAIAVAGQLIPLNALASAFAYAYPYAVMLASSMCMLCLAIYAVPAWSFIRKLLAIPALFILPGLLVLFFSQAEGEIQNWFIPLAYAVAPLILLVSFFLAGRHCRRRWGMGRFSVLVLAWNFLFLFGVMLLFLGYQVMRQPFMRQEWWMILMPFVILLLVAVAVLFAIAFAFILTTFLSPLYRERLIAAFGVVPALQPEQAAIAENPPSPGHAG